MKSKNTLLLTVVLDNPDKLVVVVVVCNGEGEESGDEVDELSCGIWISCFTPPVVPPFASYMPGDETCHGNGTPVSGWLTDE